MTDEPTCITVDWSTVAAPDQLFDVVLPQMGAPSWHGRNLDALNDSWVTGGICANGPPFVYRFINDVPSDAMAKYRTIVEQIARDSVRENGGRLILRR